MYCCCHIKMLIKSLNDDILETPTTAAPTTTIQTTNAPTTTKPTTLAPTTPVATTAAPTTVATTTAAPTTVRPTTSSPTTVGPTTSAPTTAAPATMGPTTAAPTTMGPTTAPTTKSQTTRVTPTKTEDKLDSIAEDLKPGSSENSIDAALNWIVAHLLIPTDASNPKAYAEKYLSVCSDLVHSNRSDYWKKDKGGASNVVNACSSLIDDLAKKSDTDITIETSTIVATTKSFPAANAFEDINVALTSTSEVTISKDEFDKLEITDGQKISVSMVTYKYGELITGRSGDSPAVDKSPVSEVVAITVYVDDQKTSLPVSFELKINKDQAGEAEEPTCVFQKAGDNGEATWDTTGCEVTKSTDNKVTCHCKHTTNFAILMQVKEVKISRRDELALEWITYICCTLSIIALLVTLIVLLALRSLLRSERVIIHVNLVVALMLAQTLLLVSGPAASTEAICRGVAIMLHYFFTAVFCWMLVEGIHLYLQIVRVFSAGKDRLIPYMAVGWGSPILIVVITASTRWYGYGENGRCWLSTANGMIWAFVAPALAIIAVNCVILIMVLRILVISAKTKSDGDYDHIKAGLKGAVLLLPLLGITWLFGVISVNAHTVVFLYLFAIFNSLQGVFIFLLYCVFNAEVRRAMNRQQEKRALTRGEMISTLDSTEDSKSRNKANRVHPEDETKETEMVDIQSTVTTTTHTQMVIRRQPTSLQNEGVKSISEVD
ncbi:adhesion G protein-coupled receptor L2-like [Amphiura filiformis]|uniref:adhesion G protein-coupled receptor L2-like n=1 Tax=Amphiura filiformis TaxID=82378 RepID=UPI003B213238